MGGIVIILTQPAQGNSYGTAQPQAAAYMSRYARYAAKLSRVKAICRRPFLNILIAAWPGRDTIWGLPTKVGVALRCTIHCAD